MFARLSDLFVMSVLCYLNVKCLSNVMPRNFAVSLKGMSVLLIDRGLVSLSLHHPKTMHCVFCGESSRLSDLSFL